MASSAACEVRSAAERCISTGEHAVRALQLARKLLKIRENLPVQILHVAFQQGLVELQGLDLLRQRLEYAGTPAQQVRVHRATASATAT
eukprot:CAMPEP_0114323466 /NCGR_PEP_ID=MMETSP0059-20121206/27894_1 /TAXON_ID=36894 /ORGANISM="Pyramimonas parkeae, Strain CCMP726" /LENGTH=88 /DNA_ID=CAMNT_0001451751 /DNA_START=371 /DNA_END=633 /DNA_ORIENTATION=+